MRPHHPQPGAITGSAFARFLFPPDVPVTRRVAVEFGELAVAM